MIYIDFQSGTHGNFLDFVLNRFLANVPVASDPFDKHGSSHANWHLAGTDFMFVSGHYHNNSKQIPPGSNVVSVSITYDDLLPLMLVTFLRAGNYGIDVDRLQENTYHKLKDSCYIDTLANLQDSFFRGQFERSYNSIKDPSWPTITTAQDFFKLPQWIQDECVQTHNLEILTLTADQPNCPRHILREFFKLAFLDPDGSGPMKKQHQMQYNDGCNVAYFPFASFYNTDAFVKQVKQVADQFGFDFAPGPEFLNVHNEFLKRQPFKFSKVECDFIYDGIVAGRSFVIPKLNLLKESYLTAKLEKHYNKECYLNSDKWFTHSTQVQQYFQGTA